MILLIETRTTDRKHWENGHQIRGGYYHTLNFSCYFFGIMFAWGKAPRYPHQVPQLSVSLFKLI